MRRNRYANYGAAAVDDSSAALETDVMRFIAIIALSLVAIFALVKSLPLGTPAAAPIATPTPIPQPAREKFAQRAPHNTQAVREAIKPTRQSGEIPQKTVFEPTTLPVVEPQRQAERSPLASNEPTARATQSTPMSEEAETSPPPKPMPERKAVFTLSFRSNDALLALLSTGKVQLYAVQAHSALQVNWRAGRALTNTTTLAGATYEMLSDSVPETLQRAVPEAPNRVWRVALWPDAETALGRITRRYQGADIVIEANGRVVAENTVTN